MIHLLIYIFRFELGSIVTICHSAITEADVRNILGGVSDTSALHELRKCTTRYYEVSSSEVL